MKACTEDSIEVDGAGASSKNSSTVNLSCSGCIPDAKLLALLAFSAYTGSTFSKHGYRKASQGAKRSALSGANRSQATLIFDEQVVANELVGRPACSYANQLRVVMTYKHVCSCKLRND